MSYHCLQLVNELSKPAFLTRVNLFDERENRHRVFVRSGSKNWCGGGEERAAVAAQRWSLRQRQKLDIEIDLDITMAQILGDPPPALLTQISSFDPGG